MNGLDIHSRTGIEFFAGVGGLALGLHMANPNYRTVAYVEREASAAATLVARMEDKTLDKAPIWDDIKTFDGKPWRGLVDIISGGYPCQPESTAGKRLGNKDPRWLWPDLKRITGEIEPEELFFENVSGHLNPGFFEVATDIHSMGYTIAAGLFSAEETGANHERLRLFILAYSERYARVQRFSTEKIRGRQGEAKQIGMGSFNMANTNSITQCPNSEQPNTQSERRGYFGRRGSKLANSSGAGSSIAKQPGQPGQPERGFNAGSTITKFCGTQFPLFAPGPEEFEAWCRTLEEAPFLEPSICRVANGMAGRVDRLRLCGNGVSSLAGAYAYRTLSDALREYIRR